MKQEQFHLSDHIGLSLKKAGGKSEHFANSEFNLRVNVTLELRDAAGNLKDLREIHNTVTTAGLAGIMDQLVASPSLGKATHGGLGTGTPTGSALGAEVGTRQAFSQKTRSGAVVTHVYTFDAGNGTGAITEAGIFDASASGNMWMSASFSTVNKAAGDALTVTWTLTAS